MMRYIFLILVLVLSSLIGQEKPKVLITNFHPHNSGGHLTFIRSLVTGPLKEEFEFAVACPESSDLYATCQALHINTYPCHFPSKLRNAFSILSTSFGSFRRIVQEFKPDLIHTNGGADRNIALLSRVFSQHKPPILQTVHWAKVISPNPINRLIHNHLLSAHLFVSPSAYQMHQAGGLPLENVWVIENGVDIESFSPRTPDEALRKQLGIPEGYFIFGSNAGLASYKRFDLLLEALTLFPTDAPFRVIALGHNPEPWMEKAKELGVDHFLCLPGFQKDVRPYCSLFDVGFILSTAVEASPYSSREMMAMGIPLIASYYSGLKDNIEDHVNGIFVGPGHVQQIVQAMQKFLEMSPEELAVYREQAHAKAVRAFNQEQQMARIKALYLSLL